METTIQQLTENARVAYNNADNSGKKLLSDLFGADLVTPQKITDRIKTWEDVCKFLSIDPIGSLPFVPETNPPKAEGSANAYFKLCKIIEVLNEGWEPNWDNSGERKYYPWFDMEATAGSGFGLSYDDCDCASLVARVSALAFALNPASWPSMLPNSFLVSTRII
jgi:hypothetical protein